MKEKLWFTCEVLEELRISYSTLFNVKRKLGMLSKDGSRKTRYSDQEVELIKQELKKQLSMAFFVVDLEFVNNLEITLLKRLKPDEILLISYIKSFPKGYYGSKDNLAFVLGICRARVFKILKYFINN